MTDKWYNSLDPRIYLTVLVFGVGAMATSCWRSCSNVLIEEQKAKERIEQYKLNLQEANLFGKRTPETFYTIDNKIAVVTIDGQPVSEWYNQRGK